MREGVTFLKKRFSILRPLSWAQNQDSTKPLLISALSPPFTTLSLYALLYIFPMPTQLICSVLLAIWILPGECPFCS